MFINMFAKMALWVLISLLYSGEAKSTVNDLQSEWQGYYNNVEATLLQKDPKVYNEDIAKAALIFSGTVYEADVASLSLCMPDFNIKTYLSTTIDSGTIRGFVGDYDKGKYIVAAFEGTDSNWQLLNEWANLGEEAFNGNESMYVVKYWNMIALDQINNVTAALQELVASYPRAPIIVTGHSLGAATATLILAYLFVNDEILLPMDRLFIYTFGQPRAGGYNFASWYNGVYGARHFRVIHYNDMVPHAPCCKEWITSTQCRSSGDQYDPWHVMTEIYYNSTSMTTWKICEGEPLGEDTSCSYSVPVYDYSLTNHLTYFDARVGYMCEIIMGKYPSMVKKTKIELSLPSMSLICVA